MSNKLVPNTSCMECLGKGWVRDYAPYGERSPCLGCKGSGLRPRHKIVLKADTSGWKDMQAAEDGTPK